MGMKAGTGNAVTSTDVLIVGGGAAGLSVAARLARVRAKLDVTVLEPSSKHYYQPLWTLVGAGVGTKEGTQREEKDLIPYGVRWVQDAAVSFLPETNTVLTRDGRKIEYKFLVLSPGLQLDWHKIPGLLGNVGKHGICSNYAFETVDSTWDAIRHFRGGTALFTFPNTPVKCGGAPQKIMYLAEHYFRKSKVREGSTVAFHSAQKTIFAVKKYADALTRVIQKRGIKTHFAENLVELHPEARDAVFQNVDTGEKRKVHYDMIHVTPPMSAPDFIKQSPFAAATGWIDVNPKTLQSAKFANVFGIGDASNLPTSKTGAAIRKQAPVLVANLLALRAGQRMETAYDGYTSCPLVTGYGKLILAEFDYELTPKESFPFDQSKERLSMYALKKHVLPELYWKGMLKGLA